MATRRLWSRAATWLIGLHVAATAVAFLGWLELRWGNHPPSWLELVLGLMNLPVAHTLVSAVVLGLTTVALVRRKRVGLWTVAFWQAVGIYLGLATFTRLPQWWQVRSWWNAREVVAFLDVASVPVGVVVLVFLWRLRGEFPARLRSGSWPLAAVTFVGGTLVTWSAAYAALVTAGGLPAREAARTLRMLVARSVGLGAPGALHDLGGVPAWIPQLASGGIAATLAAVAFVFLRTARDPHRWSAATELDIRRLLHEFGDEDSLGFFATRRDKSVVFSADRRAAVAYRVVHGVSIASGDPVGDPAAWRGAILAWREEAHAYGWYPAVLAASARGARAYAETGLSVLNVGDEAILEVERFGLEGPAMAPVRQAVRRARASGCDVRIVRQGQLDEAERGDVARLADRWRQGPVERGFSMALDRTFDPADTRGLLVIASDPDRTPVALLSFVPWGRTGVSLDLMRRSPQAPPGVNELMVATLMERGAEFGLRRVSLNFCMFRRVYADAAELGSGTLTRLNHSVLGFFDRFWQLERLYRVNRQYRPTWSPRYACYLEAATLPKVALAMAAAEGFITPRILAVRAPQHRLTPDQVEAVAAIDATPTLPPVVRRPRRSAEERARARHLDELEASGRSGYPAADAQLPVAVADLKGWDDPAAPAALVVGRLGRIRDHGGVAFVDLTDGPRTVQLVVERRSVGGQALSDFVRWCDRGDLVRVCGAPTRSRSGTPSLAVAEWTMLAKCLRPLGDATWVDPDSRARRRSEDLLVHPGAAAALRRRTAVVRALRAVLDERGFLEVETPLLHAVHGGATARPFVTHLNAYATDVSLRIAPELYLKRLLVAGLGPLYELGRSFRNEGVDATHNPEFTSLEAYQPFTDYHGMRLLAEDLVRAAAVAVMGRPVVRIGGRDVDLGEPFPVVSVLDAVARAVGRPVGLDLPAAELAALARAHGVDAVGTDSAGTIIERLYGALVEPRTERPTFYIDFPIETSPLTRPHRSVPGLAERWDLVAAGMELGTAYTELTDPVEQRRRLTAQSLQAAGGDAEAMELDEAFLTDLELGMPPSGGLGLGVDRLVMLLVAAPIRGVLAFPFVRPPLRGSL